MWEPNAGQRLRLCRRLRAATNWSCSSVIELTRCPTDQKSVAGPQSLSVRTAGQPPRKGRRGLISRPFRRVSRGKGAETGSVLNNGRPEHRLTCWSSSAASRTQADEHFQRSRTLFHLAQRWCRLRWSPPTRQAGRRSLSGSSVAPKPSDFSGCEGVRHERIVPAFRPARTGSSGG